MLQSRTANFKGVLTFCEMAENDDKARLEKRSGKKRKSMGSSSAAVAAEALKKSRTRIVAQADYPPKHPDNFSSQWLLGAADPLQCEKVPRRGFLRRRAICQKTGRESRTRSWPPGSMRTAR